MYHNIFQSLLFYLENGVKGLVYSGDKDFICNWRGGEAWYYILIFN
jgi:carboxypeptidase C (cathepsin A)